MCMCVLFVCLFARVCVCVCVCVCWGTTQDGTWPHWPGKGHGQTAVILGYHVNSHKLSYTHRTMYTHMLLSQGEMLTAHGHMSSHSQVDPTGIQTAITFPSSLLRLSLFHWWTQRSEREVALCVIISSVSTQQENRFRLCYYYTDCYTVMFAEYSNRISSWKH